MIINYINKEQFYHRKKEIFMIPEKKVFEMALGRSMAGTIGGLIAVILSILGLARIYPILMLSITTIVVGVTLLFKGLAIAAEYSKILTHTSGTPVGRTEINGGISVEMLAGVTGIVLGVLSLLDIQQGILEPVAAIVFGSALALGTGVLSRLNSLKMSILGIDSNSQKILEDIVTNASGIQLMIGMSAVVLGILGLIGMAPLTLTLIAMLAVGVAILISGSSLTAKILAMVKM